MKNRIEIRLAQPKEDVQALLEIYTPYVLHTAIVFELSPPDETTFAQRIKDILAEAPFLVCTIDGQVAGYAYAAKHRWRAAYQWTRELSVYVHPHFRQRQIASALYQTLFPLLKLQNYRNVLAGITLPNEASIRFHKKMGFELVGIYNNVGFKLGQSHRVGWWERPLIDHTISAKEIIAPNQLQGSEDWQSCLDMGRRILTN